MKKIKLLCKKYNISWRFIKFLFVGILNTFFGYGIFAIFNFAGLHYSISTLLATILGILFNFKTTGILVFENRNNKLIIKFLLVYSFTYILTVLALSLFDKFQFRNMYINYGILLPFNAIVSYVLMKKFVFFYNEKINLSKSGKFYNSEK